MESDTVTAVSTNTKQTSAVVKCIFLHRDGCLRQQCNLSAAASVFVTHHVLPCGVCKQIKDSVLGGNMSIYTHEYVHCMSLCRLHKRRRLLVIMCLRRLFGSEKSRRCHGKTDERRITRGRKIKRERSTKWTCGRVPHLLSSWLMLMYISQVVSSAIPPWGTSRLIPAEERRCVWKLVCARLDVCTRARHTPARLSGLFTEVDSQRGDGPGKRWQKQVSEALWIRAASFFFVSTPPPYTHTHMHTDFLLFEHGNT